MQEIWKDIEGYEGLYQVSNLGNVKSLSFGARNIRKSNVAKFLKQSPTNCGYYKVELYNNGERKMMYVHRLVALAFIPNPEQKSQVNHIDGDKSNNVASNLEWVSSRENLKHATDTGLRTPTPMAGKRGRLNKNSKPILQYDLSGTFIARWDSIADAGRYFGNASQISLCLTGRHKTAYGFKWEYE